MKEQINSAKIENPNGFALVELLIAIVLLSFGALALVQLTLLGMKINTQTTDDTEVATLAQWKIENLMGAGYNGLTPGGDLNTQITNYYEKFTQPGSKVEYTTYWKVVPCGSDSHTDPGVSCSPSEEYFQTPWYQISVRVAANRIQQVSNTKAREVTIRAQIVQPF